ncbi:hypothetical protein GCM10012288_10780 [Malaciobacter pacificus]|jgi:hypothetical protein|uniref:Uncharacterized protein n=1 Tax=Malaciobacter pacificus TaxID=1080223 RepID=A0A5C2H985_9BACT|nr:hypothetical protein [Malaciobacter pacificus]QEP35383.1 hypothetical protein APAC_2323 [Malaciobacter pacificus]GGD38603.1 hypothetical protein GCM10012288_10780 [Malaciobacter pacificus]
MIEKLYNLKKTQTDQKLMQKAQIQSEIEKIDTEILLTKNSIDTATVQQFGAISDFTILTIHKNTMRAHIKKLEGNKVILNEKLETLIAEIIELQKETEQFAYLLDEEKKEAIKKLLLAEQEASEEYIQSKYISG